MTSAETDAVFAKIAQSVAAKNRGVAESDDIKQELWLWWLSHDKPDLEDADWALTRTLHTVAERYAAKERTARVPTERVRYTDYEVMALVEMLVSPPTDAESVTAEMADVLTAVANLPDDLKGPLTAYATGEPYRVIAEDMGVSQATAFRRVQQAINQVVATLNGEK